MTSVSSTASLLSSSTSTSSTTSSSSTSSTDDIDWDGLIEEAVQAKLSKADSIDLKITENEAKSAAYESAQSLLSALADAAEALRAPSGSSSASTDVFNSRAAYLSANGNVDASSSIAATVESGADIGSFDLTVLQLAKAHKITSAAQSSRTTELSYAGSFTLGTVDGSSAQIDIESDMTLDEIAEAINAQTDTTGVKATVLKVTDSSYQLVLSGSETGTTIEASFVSGSGDDVLNALGVTQSDGSFADELQAAAQAIFTVDGVEITRSSNDVSDVIDGVTLHLYQVTPDETSVTVEIGTDLSAVKDAIVALVDAYNAYRDFAYEQQQLPSDDNTDSTVLFGDVTLRGINNQVADALNTLVDSNSLSLLGLSFDTSNKLELDEDVLDDALLSDLDAIQSLLSFQMSSSSSDLMLLGRGTTVPSDFTLDVSVDSSGAISGVSVNGNASLFTVSGTRIVGAEGSVYEGYSFVYVGDSASVDVSFSTGIAERLYNVSDAASDDSDGTLRQLMDQIAETDETLEAKSEDIRAKAETYRTNLTNRYAAYQSAISEAESMLDYLEQLLDTWNSSS